ncbi:MAG TPA: hypothetical protein PKO41_04705 [Dokdonella sp.]|uniref:hypothetical protein n=1 Tax=Dokdonella sp. TaxID=2291710 RepID=UPI0025C12285|nr:hypothetical protein [Dokdonella sp.]MBX3691643.1 hypothetical protein [Dokdonella sp.]MCW5568272.1 hypothetical protein [Dokdonella sp.]HNR91711.1 hypothetical protein [Dokdonella sp.]
MAQSLDEVAQAVGAEQEDEGDGEGRRETLIPDFAAGFQQPKRFSTAEWLVMAGQPLPQKPGMGNREWEDQTSCF